jgi:hypothetical protein
LIRARDPYVDVEPVSASPLKPGGEQDFRLIFDGVSSGLGRRLSGDSHPPRRDKVTSAKITG